MNQLKITVCLFILLVSNAGYAQGQRNRQPMSPAATVSRDTGRQAPRLALLARNYGDSVVLRWAPDRAGHFLAGSQTGYWVQRVELSARNPKGKKEFLSPVPIKPWTLDQARNRVKPTDRFAAIGMQMLYGQGYTKTFTPDAASIIDLSEEQNNRFAVAMLAADYSPKAADALGLRWVDRQPRQPDAVYIYRIYSANAKPTAGDLLNTAAVVVIPKQLFQPVAPLIEEIKDGDSTITLVWNQHNTQGAFSGFHIERSSDGQSFKRLTDTPFIQSQADEAVQRRDSTRFRTDREGNSLMTFTDSVKVNYRKFYYRIVGVDAFGDLSPPSAVVSGMARDLTPPMPPHNLRTEVIDNKRVKVLWNRSLIAAPDVAGYVVGRAPDVNGPFTPLTTDLLPVTAQEYIDNKPNSYGNYYNVAVVDTAGNVAFAPAVVAIIADLVPPKAPEGLTAKTDTNGVAQLTWPLGTDDDIVAYKVYRSYERDNDFYRPLTSYEILALTYLDTLPRPMLNKVVYYKIVAIDRTGNHSALSAPLEVKVPDRIPPTPPVIRSVVVDAGGVTLDVLPSSSPDVVEHRLYRREGDGDWTLLRQIPNPTAAMLTLRDTTFQGQPELAEKKFAYALTAVDDARLESPKSFPAPVQLGSAPAASVQQLRAEYDPNRAAVTLRWEFAPGDRPYHFVVYRALNGEGLTMFKAVDSQKRDYQDTALSPSGSYQYAIRVQYHQGGGSPLSPTVSITK